MFGPPKRSHLKMNVVPEGGAQSAPVRPRGAFGGPPKRRDGWDALRVLGGTLRDLDGSMGYGHREQVMQGVDRRRAQMAQQQAEAQRKAQMEAFAQNLTPEQQQMFGIAPNAVIEGMSEQMFAKPGERKIIKAADGFNYYADTQERVLPNAESPASKPDWQETVIQTPQGPMRKIYDANSEDPMSTMRDVGAEPEKGPLVQNTINGPPSKDNLTPFQLAQDNKYAALLTDWNTGGGADAAKQMDQLNEVADALESGRDDLTGFLVGMTPQWALEGLNPDAVDKKELVEEVVQRNLRVVLGAQFTEKEGERLIARAFNNSLPEATNAARLRRLVQQVQQRAAQMQSLNQFVTANGTSAGWDGSLANVDQIIAEIESVGRSSGGPVPNQKRRRYNPATGEFES